MAAPCLAAGRRPSALARRRAEQSVALGGLGARPPLHRASGPTSWPGHPASRGGRLVPAAVLSGGEPACFASGEQKLAGDPRPRGFFRAIECLPWPHSLLSLFDARRELEASGVGGGGLTSRVRSLIWSLRGPLIQYPACLRTGTATPA